MTTYKIMRVIFCASLAVGTLLWASPTPSSMAQAQGTSRRMNNIEVSGRFLQEWGKQGSEQSSLYVNGLPITTRRPEISLEDGKLYDTQWFERARYEAHPDNKPPYDVLLGRLGSSTAEGRGRVDPATKQAANPADLPFVGIDKPADVDGKSMVWFPETKHTISGKLLEYWNRYGGLQQFGFPLSQPLQELSEADGKTYTVQYFERNRMELHPEKAAPYDVELGLLGVEQFGMQAVPGDQLPVAPPKDARTTKDTIIIGMSRDPANLSLADNSSEARRIRSLIEDQLVGRDENENLFPLNAWYMPTLENGGARFIGQGGDRYLQVKYKLRQGIQWSDGVELTSNDAIFAYRLMLDPSVPVTNRAEYQKLQNIDNPNKYTIIYNYRSLNQATAYYNALPWEDLDNYGFISVFISQKKPVVSRTYSQIGVVYPEHVLGKIPPAKIPESDAASAPTGTGPWKVEGWTKVARGVVLTLVPNKYYSLTAKPLINKIVIELNDYSILSLGPQSGSLDLVTSEVFNQPPTDEAAINGKGYKVVSRLSSTWEHLDFRLQYHILQEQSVRVAIMMAINRQRIIDAVYQGKARMMNSVIPPNVYFSLENPDFPRNYPDIAAKYKLPVRSYDPNKAVQLLESSGWTCPFGTASPGCGGQPREKNGAKLSFIYGTTTEPFRRQVQALVSADLKAIGIGITPTNYPSSAFLVGGTINPQLDGKLMLAQFSWTTGRYSDFGNWQCPFSVFDASAGYHGPMWSCLMSGFLDKAADIFYTETDLHTQISAAADVQSQLMNFVATVPLYQQPNTEIVRDNLANYKLGNSLTSSFWNARQWYFK